MQGLFFRLQHSAGMCSRQIFGREREGCVGTLSTKGEGMSRLIDVDALIKDFDKRCFGECCCCIESTNTESGCKVIDEQPTVDAVPVVRCKDCKECEERHTANYLPFLYCKLHEHSVSYNAFCCWAERRKGTDD